ncbi:MAG: hypothetical protein ACI39G_06065 [Pseudoramibacter sp.]
MNNRTAAFQLRTQRWTQKEFCFFLAYGLYLIGSVWDITFFQIQYGGIAYKWVLFAVALILIIKECFPVYDIKRSVIVGAAALALLVAVYISHNHDLILNPVTWILIFVFTARDIEFKKIAEFTLKLGSLLFIITVVCSGFGVIKNYVETGVRIRYYLGFKYALYPSVFLSNLTALAIWLKKNRMSWSGLIALAVLNLLMYSLTDARLAAILCLLMIVGAAVLKWRRTRRRSPSSRRRGRMLVWAFVLCLAVSVGATLAYSGASPWQQKINNALGKRLELGQDSLQNHGVRPFGEAIKMSGNALNDKGRRDLSKTHGVYNYVDCMYIQMLQNFGWVLTALLIAMMTLALYRAYQKGDTYLLMIGGILALHGMIDDLILNIYQNTFWLVLSPLVIWPLVESVRRARQAKQQ